MRLKLAKYLDPETGHCTLFNIDSPEKELCIAILIRAIEDYLTGERGSLGPYNYRTKGPSILAAHVWLFDTSSKEVCSVLWILDYVTTDALQAHRLLTKLLLSASGRERLSKALRRKRVHYTGKSGNWRLK